MLLLTIAFSPPARDLVSGAVERSDHNSECIPRNRGESRTTHSRGTIEARASKLRGFKYKYTLQQTLILHVSSLFARNSTRISSVIEPSC